MPVIVQVAGIFKFHPTVSPWYLFWFHDDLLAQYTDAEEHKVSKNPEHTSKF
jgi:hypothetical protein